MNGTTDSSAHCMWKPKNIETTNLDTLRRTICKKYNVELGKRKAKAYALTLRRTGGMQTGLSIIARGPTLTERYFCSNQ